MITSAPSTQPQTAAGTAAQSQLSWPGHAADDTGATFGPDPMASLVATADALVLSSPRGNFRIPRRAVTRIGRGNMYPWFFAAVRIHHTVSGLPLELQFKPLGTSPRDVRRRLGDLGYPAA